MVGMSGVTGDGARAVTPRSAPPRTLPVVLLVVLCALALAALWLLVTYPRDDTPYWGLFGNFIDVHVYRWGGEYVREGLDLYAADLHGLYPSDAPRGQMPFTYAPFAAVLFVPLSTVGATLMEGVWTVASIGAAVAIAALMFRWLGYTGRRATVAAVACATIMLFTEPVKMTLWLGQINLFLLLLLVWDAQRPESSRLRGVATGIAAGIKLTPAFLWAHQVVTGQWRTAATSVATFLATMAVGFAFAWGSSVDYFTGGLVDAGRIGAVDAPSNQSVNGVLSWYVFDGHAPTWAWLLCAVPVALLGLAAAALIHRRGEPQLAFVLSGMTGCMVSPFSWGHHWVWFLPLLVVLIDLLLRHATRGAALVAWVLPALLLFLVGAWTEDFEDPVQPDGRWVGTGWFMSRPAMDGPFELVLREPYVVVWLLTLVLGVAFAARRTGRSTLA